MSLKLFYNVLAVWVLGMVIFVNCQLPGLPGLPSPQAQPPVQPIVQPPIQPLPLPPQQALPGQPLQPQPGLPGLPGGGVPGQTCRFHSVRPGDTINDLAKIYNVNPQAILRANPNVVPQNLQINQQLCIPS